MSRLQPIGVTLAIALVASCGGLTATPAPTRFPGALALPSVHIEPGELCAGVGLIDAVLAGDPADARLAWVTSDTTRIDVVFPDWLGARFTPELEIVDQAGQVVARAGDLVDGGCVNGGTPGNPLLILWR